MKNQKVFLVMGIVLLFLAKYSYADVVTLDIPIVADSPNQHQFYHELLTTAVQESGHTAKLVTKKYPQQRIKKLLDDGKISIYWMVESAGRNEAYIPIEVGLTNGLIGKRILFIKKGDQHLYDKVNNLDDFRNLGLVGGMGKNWFDVKVWKANNLKYKEQSGNWRAIFKMIPKGRDYNYFSRGLNEIIVESQQYTNLAIEQRLALNYDRDFRFYLSKTGPKAGAPHREILSAALQKAKSSGLIEKLVRKYWASDFESLKYDERVQLTLVTPK